MLLDGLLDWRKPPWYDGEKILVYVCGTAFILLPTTSETALPDMSQMEPCVSDGWLISMELCPVWHSIGTATPDCFVEHSCCSGCQCTGAGSGNSLAPSIEAVWRIKEYNSHRLSRSS